MDIHVQPYKTDVYQKKKYNKYGTKFDNKMPSYIQETDNFKAFKKKLKFFLLYHAVWSAEEFVSL